MRTTWSNHHISEKLTVTKTPLILCQRYHVYTYDSDDKESTLRGLSTLSKELPVAIHVIQSSSNELSTQ